MAPSILPKYNFSFFPLNIKIPSSIDTPIKNIISINRAEEITIGLILEETPNINNILNILDPRTFPIAISFSPFVAAIIEVTNSGRDVPIATIVNPTNFSLKPKE